MRLYVAPLQGYTGSAWRRFHSKVYGPVAEAYISPFVRVEKGEPRRRDLRDIAPDDCTGYRLVPQIIFRNMDEFNILADAVCSLGYREIDLNMGCPFPLQTGKGRGAAMVGRRDLLEEVAREMENRRDVTFSVKMRLGMENPDEWKGIAGTLNAMPLSHITVHPRTAMQGYGGELYLESFGEFLDSSRHPVIFNGELHSPADCIAVGRRFPTVSGVMIGRGLLARPSLAAEIATGEEWDRDRRIAHILSFHRDLSAYSRERYCGESQILSMLKPFWDYLEPEIGRKVAKRIRKAGSLRSYGTAVSEVR